MTATRISGEVVIKVEGSSPREKWEYLAPRLKRGYDAMDERTAQLLRMRRKVQESNMKPEEKKRRLQQLPADPVEDRVYQRLEAYCERVSIMIESSLWRESEKAYADKVRIGAGTTSTSTQ